MANRYAFTLIVDHPHHRWAQSEIQAARKAGLDGHFEQLGPDAYLLLEREDESFGQAVGSAIDILERSTGLRVMGVQREAAS